jgi:hypothetical protein
MSGDLDNAKARVNPPIPPPLRGSNINSPKGRKCSNKTEPDGDVELAGWFRHGNLGTRGPNEDEETTRRSRAY